MGKRKRHPWYAYVILVLASIIVVGGWGLSFAKCDDKLPVGRYGNCDGIPVVECDYPDSPVCWCTEVDGDEECGWYCVEDPIKGHDEPLGQVCTTTCYPHPQLGTRCITRCRETRR